ncbi:MAG: protein translocase subunit SecD [Clostridia bacterium]|nr:protein translocase subunit SecD [Clostridia bacterium]
MKKKSSIVKLTLIGVALIIGIILSVCSFQIPGTFYNYNSFASSIKLGLDLKGGIYAVYEADDAGVSDFETKLAATQNRLTDLLVDKGYTEAVITTENGNRLRVEVPDVDNPSAIFKLIGKPADLAFVLDETGETVMTGEHITNAVGYYDTQQAAPVVSLEFDSVGAEQFGQITSNNVNKAMSIYIVTDGVRADTPISTATINEAIMGGKAQITMSGQETQAALDLASQIMSGTFDVKLSLKESSTVSPTLGEQALTYGIIAGLVGLLLVVIFLIWRYRLYGVVATLALAIYTVLMLFFLAVFPWVQLTLPGIAGIILSLGMAVDGNVVIYERIRDEYANGKSVLAANHAGFKKAFWAILDSNVTTVIASIVLIIFGTGSIKGFGITLLIGIVLSFLTSVFVTRGLCNCFTAITNTNPKLYNLKRGKNYVEPVVDEESDDTDAPANTDKGVLA